MKKEFYQTIVIGGGASGLMFAAVYGGKATKRDAQSSDNAPHNLIIDGNDRLGVKLAMTGGGRCNITRAGSIKDFQPGFGAASSSIRTCLYKHNNLELIDLLHTNGVDTIAQADNRVFPADTDAKGICRLFTRLATDNGFDFLLNTKVVSISPAQDGAPGGARWILKSKSHTIYARNVVIATGGCSYPTTGSDGRFHEVLKRDLAVNITDLHPALSPIKVTSYPYKSLAGISLSNVQASIYEKTPQVHKLATINGDLLFTHNSFSGPALLNISGYAESGRRLVLNYINEPYDTTCKRLQNALHGSTAGAVKFIAGEYNLPRNFCKAMLARQPSDASASPKRLAALLTSDEFQISASGTFTTAMVTRGGIDRSEIDFKTMQLIDHPSLYAIGEIIDVDGISGGYNLQFAYSSAKTAAESIRLSSCSS